MQELDRLFGNPLFLPRFSQKLADYNHALSSYSSFVASRRRHDSMNPFLLAENRHPPPPRPRPRSPVQEFARVDFDINPPSIASSATSSSSDSAAVDINTDHQEAEPNTLDWSQIEDAEQEPNEYSQSPEINDDDDGSKGDHDDAASAASLEASSADVQGPSLCVLQHMNTGTGTAAEIDVKHGSETKRNRSHDDDDDDGASHPSSPSRSSSFNSPSSSNCKRQRLSSSILADESDSSARPLSPCVAFPSAPSFPPFAPTYPDPSPTASTHQSPLLRGVPNVNNVATSVDSAPLPPLPPSVAPSFDPPPPFVPPAKPLVGVETNPGDGIRAACGATQQDGEAHQCAICIRTRLSANLTHDHHPSTSSGNDDSIQPGSRIFLTSKGGIAMDLYYETALLPSRVYVCASNQLLRPSSSSSSSLALTSTTVVSSSSRSPPPSTASPRDRALLSSSTLMIINQVSSASIASDLRLMGIVRSDADVQEAMRKCPRGDNQMIIDQLMMDRDSEDVNDREEQAEEEEGGGEESQEPQEEELEVEEELEEEEDGEEEEDYRWRAKVGRYRVMHSARKSGSSTPFSNVQASDDEEEEEQSVEDSNDEDYSEE